ncbi:AraC family transcriptional regulator [Billgrantia aerodenitrificans]|jgi:AraC-like DNA-binding protein|uniref:Helix-turn-helix transcriptional regulator n=1 Tax=Billgrantia aerodenitrificans TaxID=2733483 RepID=A0ABS9AVK0_9GAMM|nr:AraC family transcriptional regulator [Halomonas aerodenitrificans]MCE8025668.1 helix-turn-helix transcriptional regulator [Halomonas aerodenitrificans]
MDSPLVETRSYPDRELSDRHGFHQLLLGLDGALELEAAGRLIHVTRAVLAPVASGDLHHYLAPGDNRVLVLDLPEAWCEALLLDGLFEGPARRLPEALMARGECLRKAKMGESGQALARWLELALEAGGRRLVPPRLKLLDLLPAMRADLAHTWRVAEMARRCHLAEAVFARQFRALTGLSPHEWLVRQRLSRACELLQVGGASLTEVALACGFADSAHFSRSFRRQHDVSPSEWRRLVASGGTSKRGQDSTSRVSI